MEGTTEIWETFSSQLLNFIKSKVSNKEDAYDLLQEIFIKIHTQLNRLEDEQKIEAWVYQISRYTIQDYYRGYYRASQKMNESVEQLQETPEENQAYQQVAYCCWEPFVTQLPEKYRIVFELSLQGHKQAAIAQQLNTSLSNVKMRLQRAKEMLKKEFISCCGYHLGENGKLKGDQDCQRHCHEHS
ncbi:hypothetical protein BKI52_06765 [marine bacterium AO1-C]|nr:hypothetical protein BKI52_06765 [marine bacterium AO1-C]